MSVIDDYEPPPPDLHIVDDARPNPQHNIAAERALLGILLTNPHLDLAADLSTHVRGPDFHQTRHELIWDAIQHLIDHGEPADTPAVIAHLQTTGDLRRGFDPAYLIGLRDETLYPDRAPAYAKMIRDAARIRGAATALQRGLTALDTAGDPSKVEQALERAMDAAQAAVERFGPAADRDAPSGLHDLAWLLSGTWPVVDPPIYGHRTDGGALFYRGRVNGIFGDPETGKTWLAKWAMLDAQDDGLCAIVDVDHNGIELTISHMLLLGAKPDWLADPTHFRYYEPDDATELTATVDQLRRERPAYVLMDSYGEMLPMLGIKSVDNDEISAAGRRLFNPLADTGACVVVVDHLPKSIEARSTGYAIGGTAKKRAVDGSYLRAEVVLAPSPGALGKVTLRIEKDRPGELRKSCGGSKYVGQFVLDSRDEHITKAKITRGDAVNEAGEFRPTHLMETVSRLVEEQPNITLNTIVATVRGKKGHVVTAVQILIEEGYIVPTQGPNRSTRHSSEKPYREGEEETDEEIL